MCDFAQFRLSNPAVGRVYRLCDEPITCILRNIYGIEDPSDLAAEGEIESAVPENGTVSDNGSPTQRYVPGQSARSLLESFVETATYVVEEAFYFDVDYRSEYGLTLPKSFARRSAEVSRIHFFAIPEPTSSSPIDSISEFVASCPPEGYLGYTIVRPQLHGMVGRSIVSPQISPSIAKDTERSIVRTVVSEPIQVFGVPLIAMGVPFMEQDGHLLRCAHVSAWICHYSAFLRGLTPRKTTGRFHIAGADAAAAGREYPSVGLTTATLNSVLRALNLPPEILADQSLIRKRELTWADRSRTVAEVASLVETQNAADAKIKEIEQDPGDVDFAESRFYALREASAAHRNYDRFWVRENLSSSVCRYLNSSIPSIIAREKLQHTQVAVGYVRNYERSDFPPNGEDRFAVTALVVSDDLRGPFTLVELNDLVEEVLKGETTVLTPLPRSIWLSGSAAERSAVGWFSVFASEAREELSCQHGDQIADGECADTNHAALVEFEAGLTDGANRYTLRSYLVTGADFKLDLPGRLDPDNSLRTLRSICEMQLPKFIWVCEVVERSQNSHEAATRATIGIDASLHSIDGEVPPDKYPLFAILPGRARIFDLLAVNPSPGSWFESQSTAYKTGRWSHNWRKNYSVERIAYRFKATIEETAQV